MCCPIPTTPRRPEINVYTTVMLDYNDNMAGRDDTDPTERPSTLGVDPVGMAEIGARLGVRRQTVAQWRFRDLLPPERWTVSGRPAWNWPDIEQWWRTSTLSAARAKEATKTRGAGRPRRKGGTR
jgi:hypothetical protein